MPRTVEYDGVTHQFPDGTSDADIATALHSYQQAKPPQQQGMLGSMWDQVRPAFTGAVDLAKAVGAASDRNYQPIKEIGRNIVGASSDQLEQARDDFQTAMTVPGTAPSAIPSALIHTAGAIPLIGPAAVQSGSKAGQQFMEGNISGGVGTLAGAIGMQLLPKALDAVPGGAFLRAKVGIPRGLNATEQAVVDFGDSHGINTAQITNNPVIKGAQQLTAATPGGSVPAMMARGRTASQLRTTGQQLMDDVHPAEVTPEIAGQSTQDALTAKASDSGAAANAAYSRFRQIEADPANAKTVQTGVKPMVGANGQPMTDPSGNPLTVPVTQSIPIPVSTGPTKAIAKPLVDELTQRMPLAQQQSNPGLAALQSILKRPDYLSASVAEDDLGALKGILRDPNATARAKYLAGQMTDALDQQIHGAVSQAGPDALQALQEGRAATAAKYRTQGTLDNVTNANAEPVATFKKLTAPQDTNINSLRQVLNETPEAAPQIGRAYLQNLFDTATAEGGFSREAGILRKWQSLGDSTKKALFNPAQIQDLDNFFLLAKKTAETANPSGTGAMKALMATTSAATGVGGYFNPVAAVAANAGTGALASLLYSPQGVQLLTNGLKIPVGATAAIASHTTKLLNAANLSERNAQAAQAAAR